MSSAGGAPPPPPPPFKFPGMVPYQPKAPPSVVSEPAPPTMASIQKAGMPAALAGAMMKDKKPFTYTPGGLNLSEIKSPSMQRRLQRNASLEGARPSPLAQQPSGKSSSPLPAQGMIQVLPMPGVGMAPVVKSAPKEPQQKREDRKKRSVCGPAPLPPPFSCGADGSSEMVEAENKNLSSHITNNSNNSENSNVTNSYPKPPVNNSDSENLINQNNSDVQSNSETNNIPIPPPIPPSNKTFYKKQKENKESFVDLTELENTINSFSDKLDKEENIILLNQNYSPEENGANENVVDSISEITDCSSPLYPEEQNSIQNQSDHSQDITSSPDIDHQMTNSFPEPLNSNNNRWNNNIMNDDEVRSVIESHITPLKCLENSISENKMVMNHPTVDNFQPIVKKCLKSISADPEVENKEIPECNLQEIKYDNTTKDVLPQTTRLNDVNDRVVRQLSLPASSMAKIIPCKIENGTINAKIKENIFQSHHSPNEKQPLEMDKPLPWMLPMKKEPSPTPDFVHHANNAQQRFQRQRSLPQSNEVLASSAPWRHPNHRSSDVTNKNGNISPDSMHLSYRGPSYAENQTVMDSGYRPMVNQSQYSTLPANHRNKSHQMNLQANLQENLVTTQSHQKERIIPIMLEPTPPVTPQGNIEGFNLNFHNNIHTNFSNENTPILNTYPSCPYPSLASNFLPYNPTSPPYSLNATEAMQQIQDNLNKLNSGLKTEESYIHNESTPHNGINVVMTSDAPAIQSKSFQLIQKAYETPRAMDPNFEENPKYTGSNIPSRSFKVLQAMTDSQDQNIYPSS